MADKLENTLLSQARGDINTATDFMRVVGGDGVSYKDDMADIVAAFLEDYDGTVLGGSEQSVQAAINSIHAAANANATAIEDLETRSITTAELTALEEALGL